MSQNIDISIRKILNKIESISKDQWTRYSTDCGPEYHTVYKSHSIRVIKAMGHEDFTLVIGEIIVLSNDNRVTNIFRSVISYMESKQKEEFEKSIIQLAYDFE